MMKITLISLIGFLCAGIAFADDPWMPDTLIIGTVYVDYGQPYVEVPVFAVTDDPVTFYIMPITWSSGPESIMPCEVSYYYPLTYWDELYDSVLVDEHYMRMIGWEDGPFYLNTGRYRWRCWQIRFAIDSLALPQIATIDTIYDPINGSLLFGLEGGVETFTPVFIHGAIYYGIPTDIAENDRTLPSEINLIGNYPNPFNAQTTIRFVLSKAQNMRLTIYDILGRQLQTLVDEYREAEVHTITFDASSLPSGVYFYRLRAGDAVETKRMVLLK